MHEQRVERPDDRFPGDIRAAVKHGYKWRAYALQLERDNAALTAEVERLRVHLTEACNIIEQILPGTAGILRAALTPPALATPDHCSDAGKMVEPPPGADARTDDGRFVSGTGYGGERR